MSFAVGAVLLTALLGWNVAKFGDVGLTGPGDDPTHEPFLSRSADGNHATVQPARPSPSIRLNVTTLAAVLGLCSVLAARTAGSRRRRSADDGPLQRPAAAPSGSRAPPLLSG